eukprot:scaffold681_cov173-Ochromonas_danica.AAC.23
MSLSPIDISSPGRGGEGKEQIILPPLMSALDTYVLDASSNVNTAATNIVKDTLGINKKVKKAKKASNNKMKNKEVIHPLPKTTRLDPPQRNLLFASPPPSKELPGEDRTARQIIEDDDKDNFSLEDRIIPTFPTPPVESSSGELHLLGSRTTHSRAGRFYRDAHVLPISPIPPRSAEHLTHIAKRPASAVDPPVSFNTAINVSCCVSSANWE